MIGKLLIKRIMRADRYRRISKEMEEPIGATSSAHWSFAETNKLINKRLDEFENDIYARLDKKPRNIWKRYLAIKPRNSWLDLVDDRIICLLLGLNYKEMRDMYLDDYYEALMAAPKHKGIDFPAFNLWLIEKAENKRRLLLETTKRSKGRSKTVHFEGPS